MKKTWQLGQLGTSSKIVSDVISDPKANHEPPNDNEYPGSSIQYPDVVIPGYSRLVYSRILSVVSVVSVLSRQCAGPGLICTPNPTLTPSFLVLVWFFFFFLPLSPSRGDDDTTLMIPNSQSSTNPTQLTVAFVMRDLACQVWMDESEHSSSVNLNVSGTSQLGNNRLCVCMYSIPVPT